MHYKKIALERLIIEFHNNWLGKETVIVNGQIVSKKSSVWGTHHDFTLLEDGHPADYILTTKVNGAMQVFIDLRKNGKIIKENIPVMYGGEPMMPQNSFKQKGIQLVRSYDINEGIVALKKATKISPTDPEIYFHLACAYSIEEEVVEGFESLRMDEEFEGFLSSNFTKYNKEKMLSRKKTK